MCTQSRGVLSKRKLRAGALILTLCTQSLLSLTFMWMSTMINFVTQLRYSDDEASYRREER